MQFLLQFSTVAKQQLHNIKDKKGVIKQVIKALKYLAHNPRHPSIHTHEYSLIPHPYDPTKKVWEAYAQNNASGAYRIFWCYGPDQKEITIIAITVRE